MPSGHGTNAAMAIRNGRARASTWSGPGADPDLPLAVVGCDFRVASASWRARLRLDSEQRVQLADALAKACDADGLVVVETCNRVEWLVAAPSPRWAAEVMKAQMLDRWLASPEPPGGAVERRPLPQPYVYVGAQAVHHLLRVAVGLESFVLGEREIAGQLNRAVVAARQGGLVSPLHNALQTAVGRTVRKVQRLTHWRQHARGVQGLAADAVRTGLPVPPEGRRVAAVVGMGEIGRKTAGLLSAMPGWRVHALNRTIPQGRAGEWLPLSALPELLPSLDALVVATGASAPVVDLGALSDRRREPLLVVDMGVPAQVRVTPRSPVTVVGLDELLSTPAVAPDPQSRTLVEELVEEGAREFVLECRKRELAVLLRAAHDAYERTAYQDLPALIDAELADLDPDRRRRLHTVMRDLLRTQTREIVRRIEAAADAGGEGQDPGAQDHVG